jgi:4-oxalocrotonate tautomerase
MFTFDRRENSNRSIDRLEQVMPLLTVKLIEGVFSPKQKQEMIRRLTDTMVEIEGESLRPYTIVLVEEVKSGQWGFGGDCFTTAAVKAVASREPTAELAGTF